MSLLEDGQESNLTNFVIQFSTRHLQFLVVTKVPNQDLCLGVVAFVDGGHRVHGFSE